MAIHRQHPGPLLDSPETGASPVLPVATQSHQRSIDVSVCEWTTDLSATPLLSVAQAQTAVGAVGYVDFDVLDSVHQPTRSDIPPRS
jgi:hypothetical protein